MGDEMGMGWDEERGSEKRRRETIRGDATADRAMHREGEVGRTDGLLSSLTGEMEERREENG
jgi:hypothetical protein